MGEKMRKNIRALTLTAALGVSSLVIPGLTTSGQAATPACSPSYHCYARVLDTADNNGARVDLYVQCLGVSDPQNSFANWEMWNVTSSDVSTWIESGQKYGIFHYGTGQTGNYIWFWAKQLNHIFEEHYVSPGTANQWVNTSITNAGTQTWTISQGGQAVATTTNPPTGLAVAAGAEVLAEPGSTLNAYLNNFQVRQGGQWAGVLPFWTNSSDGWIQGSANDGTTGAWAHAWTNNCATPTATSTDSGPPLTASSAPTVLQKLAQRLSSANGEDHPSGITFVQTSRQNAAALTGSHLSSDGPSYLVQLHGHFNGAAASVPKGAKAPRGTTLTFVVDSRDGAITDWGISSRDLPMASLGRVRTTK
jgi:hypothetical protein